MKERWNKKRIGVWVSIGLIVMTMTIVVCTSFQTAMAATSSNNLLPGVNLSLGTSTSPKSVNGTLQIIFLLTILSIAPAILILMTCFTRVIVVLSFVRSALSLQSSPPNQVLIGLALFITFFVMQPTFHQANVQALQPYLQGKMSQSVALQKAELPFKVFMSKQTRPQDLQLFLDYRHLPKPKNVADIPFTALVPAYTISELKTAFQIGFMIYLPFLVIDLVVSTTLMSMGMMMLPPVTISMPFKILLFVMVDGWHLIVQSLLSGYS